MTTRVDLGAGLHMGQLTLFARGGFDPVYDLSAREAGEDTRRFSFGIRGRSSPRRRAAIEEGGCKSTGGGCQ